MKSLVIADAGPLHYLILAGCADVLGALFGQVLIPVAVRDELLHYNAPEAVRLWFNAKKSWLSVEPVERVRIIRGLHRGEAEALQLALQTKASGVLMDDLDGRTAARRLGITVIGTIGVLERAAELDLVELPVVIAKLRQTNFFASEELLEAALQRDRKRREP